LYRIKREVVTEKHRARLELELRYIMTGQKVVEEINEKKSQGAVISHTKRSSTARKRRTKGFLSLNKSRKQMKK